MREQEWAREQEPGIGKEQNPIIVTHKTEGGSVTEWLMRRGLRLLLLSLLFLFEMFCFFQFKRDA